MPRYEPQYPTSSILSVDRSVVLVLLVLIALHGVMLALLFGLQPPISTNDRGVEHRCREEFRGNGKIPLARRDLLCDRKSTNTPQKV